MGSAAISPALGEGEVGRSEGDQHELFSPRFDLLKPCRLISVHTQLPTSPAMLRERFNALRINVSQACQQLQISLVSRLPAVQSG